MKNEFCLPFSSKDQRFMRDLFARFPVVQSNFLEMARTPQAQRIELALKKLEVRPRTGWLRFGLKQGKRIVHDAPCYHAVGSTFSIYKAKIDDTSLLMQPIEPVCETLLEHQAEGAELAHLIYKNSPHRDWLAAAMSFHDFPEAHTHDFTPLDKITPEEKAKIEELGLKILTEGKKSRSLVTIHVNNAIHLFEGKLPSLDEARREICGAITPQCPAPLAEHIRALYNETEIDMPLFKRQCKDIDVAQMMTRGARMMMDRHYTITQDKAEEEMAKFWCYAKDRTTTPEGQTFLEKLRTQIQRPNTTFNICLMNALKSVN